VCEKEAIAMASVAAGPDPIVYVNGEFVSRSQATISVFDHVILYGDGVYDTMCSWNYRVFKLSEHVDRLYESAHSIKLALPHAKGHMEAIILETVLRNDLRNAYVKVVVTRGVGAQPLLSPHDCVPGVIVFAVPYLSQAGDAGETGIRMIVSSMRRIPNECMSTKIKSCNYLNHVLMRMEANEAGADDAIELDLEGYVCEAPGYNVFAVKRKTLTTPADNILVGITRQTVIELADAHGVPVIVGRVQVFDLYNADEVFLSSTAGGIVAVVKLDGRTIGTGKPGPITKMIRDGYQSLLESGEKSTSVRAKLQNDHSQV
jgi:branched-chain amino acid aminotransferase